MKAFVAVTDNDWFEFLASQQGLDEVNFWTPSGKPLAPFQVGEPVLFKLHAPVNLIAARAAAFEPRIAGIGGPSLGSFACDDRGDRLG